MLNLFFSFHLLETFCCAKSFSYYKGNHEQCDQIGRFFGLLGNFSKPLATINLPNSPTFLGNVCKGVKNIFLMKSFLVNFYRHLAIFFWSY